MNSIENIIDSRDIDLLSSIREIKRVDKTTPEKNERVMRIRNHHVGVSCAVKIKEQTKTFKSIGRAQRRGHANNQQPRANKRKS